MTNDTQEIITYNIHFYKQVMVSTPGIKPIDNTVTIWLSFTVGFFGEIHSMRNSSKYGHGYPLIS